MQAMGAQPVASDISNFFGKFNNGQVDIIACPAVAYQPLELIRESAPREVFIVFLSECHWLFCDSS